MPDPEPDPDDLSTEIRSPEAEDGRIDWPSAIGKAVLLVIEAGAVLWLLTYCVLVRAAEPALPVVRCLTVDDVTRQAQQEDPAAKVRVYRGTEMLLFFTALVNVLGEPPDLPPLSAIGTWMSGDSRASVSIRLFDRDGCDVGLPVELNRALLNFVVNTMGRGLPA